MHYIQQFKPFVLLVSVAALAACASTGATYKSGVGDKYVEHAPYYAGASLEAVARDSSVIGHYPIVYQAGASQSTLFDPKSESGSAIASLLEAMNGYLDSLALSKPLANAMARVSTTSGAIAPDVRFGCIPDNHAANEDCAVRGDSALGRKHQQMLLAVGRPSASWISFNRALTDIDSVERTLVITLEVGQYLMRQEGVLGKKVVELGANNRAGLPWLSSLETPVTVLQLTASLIDRDGKAVRIGAEGFYPRRTRLLVSAIGGQELLREDDVTAARAYRRDDLPGKPLAWQVAMRELVGRVTGRAIAPQTIASRPELRAR